MDNLTHSLVGVALAQSGLARLSPGATTALIVGSNLPDIDILFALQGAASYLEHHRDLTHSVVGAPVLALLLAGVLAAFVRGARFLGLLAASGTAIAVHVLMDLCTSYGTRVLSPFDRTFYAWDLVFIVDPAILLVLLLTLLFARRQNLSARLATVGLGLIVAYVGARAGLHARALDEAQSRLPGGRARHVVALPSPLDPFHWRILADTGDAYLIGDVRLDGPSPALKRREKRPEDAVVTRAREASAIAQIFLSFSTFPWLEVEAKDGSTEVTWTDLRFQERGRRSFEAKVVLDERGLLRSEAFRF